MTQYLDFLTSIGFFLLSGFFARKTYYHYKEYKLHKWRLELVRQILWHLDRRLDLTIVTKGLTEDQMEFLNRLVSIEHGCRITRFMDQVTFWFSDEKFV